MQTHGSSGTQLRGDVLAGGADCMRGAGFSQLTRVSTGRLEACPTRQPLLPRSEYLLVQQPVGRHRILWLGRGAGPTGIVVGAASVLVRFHEGDRLAIYRLFLIFGLASLTGQIVLLREILVIFHGTEIPSGSSWDLVGRHRCRGGQLALFWQRGWMTDFRANLRIYSLVALGFSLIFQMLIIRLIPAIFSISPAELWAPLHGILNLAAPVGTVVRDGLFDGISVPSGLQSRGGSPDDRFIARIYAFEALGSLAGGLFLTFVLLRLLTPLYIAALMALVLASLS